MSIYLDFCEKTARQAGVALMDRFGRVTAREKGPADLVTEADFAAQELVQRRVNETFPDHLIVGEESTEGTSAINTQADFRWIVDPLDGTTNFVHRVPHFAVSLALEKDQQLEAATIFNPATGECFSAARGQGATLNDRTIRTSGQISKAEAIGAVGFPPGTGESDDLDFFLKALPTTQALRRTGSAALNMAFVACGRFDCVWSFGTSIWDIAAGTLLIQEAGGTITDTDGSPIKIESGRFLAAATAELHAELVEFFNS
jgi:myo-inositol-1(or 4)-monophosphatase